MKKLIFILILIFFASACSSNNKKTNKITNSKSFIEKGIASWYGGKYHGRKTANGEIFNKNKLTAAHKTLKFGTIVKVTNLENGKTVKVRINDRGPFIKGRIIDLSEAAGKIIGLKESGIAKVKIEKIN